MEIWYTTEDRLPIDWDTAVVADRATVRIKRITLRDVGNSYVPYEELWAAPGFRITGPAVLTAEAEQSLLPIPLPVQSLPTITNPTTGNGIKIHGVIDQGDPIPDGTPSGAIFLVRTPA